ncbi:MAG TPA: hypothetical protein VIH78_02930 [Terriglobales bacterium]
MHPARHTARTLAVLKSGENMRLSPRNSYRRMLASCLLMALSISPVMASGQAGSNGGNAAASKPAAPATGASQTTSASPASTGSTAATTAKSGAPTAQDSAAAKASAKVWVNTETGVDHKGGR